MTATFTTHDVARAADCTATSVTRDWTRRFGIAPMGHQSHRTYRFTLGQLVAARALRHWMDRHSGSPQAVALANLVCRDVPPLVDTDTPPRWLLVAHGMVCPLDRVDDVLAFTRGHHTVHLIDVQACLADLAVTPPQ